MLKRISQCLLLSLLCLLLPGCGAQEDRGPVSVSATQGDFKATFTSAQRVYNSDDLDPESPLELEVRLDYMGQEESVLILCGALLGDVDLYAAGETQSILNGPDKNGNFCEYPIESYARGITLRPNRPVVEPHTCSLEYNHLGGLPVGTYTAKTQVSFFMGDDGVYSFENSENYEDIVIDLELSFEIR